MLFVFGCSTGIQVQEIPNTANVANELLTLNNDVDTAAAEQVNVLSPHNFTKAQNSLEDAKKSSDKHKDTKDTLHKIATGRAYLKRAQEVAELSRTNIEEVVVARQEAISAGAPGLFSSDFRKADSKLKDATADFENDNIKGGTKDRADLQSSYLSLELRAIKHQNLNHAKETITKSIDDGAKKMAPQSLAIAEKNFKDTDAFITANRHENNEISKRTLVTNQSAEHLLKITHDSQNSKKVSPEELALQMESKQNQIVEKQNDLNAEQKVSQSLNTDKQALQNELAEGKSNVIALGVATQELGDENKYLEDEVNAKDSALSKEKENTQDLEEKNDKLKSEKTMNDMFEEARKGFSKEEAEVYRQGNTLTIRLRGLGFPSSKAVLQGSNFPLLAKVQKVIKDFDSSTVVVEGHTDSIGGQKANTKLATNRAEAVREYFISNGNIPEDKISAVGYGNKKPLASNQTAAGRAQNRRVDILINMGSSTKL
jgi:outer membrane protein OmpA-like peptidoglycan-associated protein